MSGKPAARLTDPTTCPLPGHGSPPISSGSADVLFDSLPAARKADTAACGQKIIGAYSSTVFINGRNAAVLGSTLDHGGAIIGGSGTVIIGDTVVVAPFIAPVFNPESAWIGFRIPTVESYAGLSCITHFDDGSTLSGTFNNDNTVLFSGLSGATCTRVELKLSEGPEEKSVTEKLLSIVQEQFRDD